MSDRDDTMKSAATLAEALRALPQSTPQPDLWPQLAAALAQRRRRRLLRYALPAALTAGLALALLLPRMPGEAPAPLATTTPTVATAPTTTADTTELADLHRRSQTLERWIAAVSAHAPQDGRDLMAAVEVEDLIGLVDVQLGGTRNDAEALPLWRQRVALLEDLATIRGNAFAMAANDGDAARTSPLLLN